VFLIFTQLPWYSVPKELFPPRARRRRKKTRHELQTGDDIQLPTRLESALSESGDANSTLSDAPLSQASTLTGNVNLETSSTSEQLETDSTQPTTPSSVAAAPKATTPRVSVRAVVPVLPVPPKASPQQQHVISPDAKPELELTPAADIAQEGNEKAASEITDELKVETPSPAPKAPPKSWADLVRSKPQRSSAVQSTNDNASSATSALASSKSNSLAEVIKAFKVDADSHFAFLEPRGLVNTGNMCYMNSVRSYLWHLTTFHDPDLSQILQGLLYCVPFYSFLEVVASRAAHSFKSETPMLDAM
jgi:ubiquitin carboxyl-terminal hydrolase 10